MIPSVLLNRATVHVRSNVHVDDVCPDSGDGCAPFFHDDADGYEVLPKAPAHHARADGVRREHVCGRARSLHANARAHVAQLGAARRRFPSVRRQSRTALSDYPAESVRRSGHRRTAPTKNTPRFSRFQYVEALRRTA